MAGSEEYKVYREYTLTPGCNSACSLYLDSVSYLTAPLPRAAQHQLYET